MDTNVDVKLGLPVKQESKKMHRRSAAVSLDWRFTQMLNRPDDMNAFEEREIKEQTKLGSKKRVKETNRHTGGENKNTSRKKKSKFRISFWVETISSLIHLYFGNSNKKMSSNVETAAVDKNEPPPPPSFPPCTVIVEPLIDLDAALLTKPEEQTTSGVSKRHLRTRSASLTLPISVGDSGGFYQRSCYKRGSSFKRKMSIIVEDMDTTSAQSPTACSFNPEKRIEDDGETVPLTKDKGDMVKTMASDNMDKPFNGFKEESEYDVYLLDNPCDMIDTRYIKGDGKLGKDYLVFSQQDSVEKKQKVKQRWYHAIKGFLTKKKS